MLFSLLMLAPSAPSSCARPRGRWGRGRGAGLSAAQGGREQTENITTDQHYLGGEGGGVKIRCSSREHSYRCRVRLLYQCKSLIWAHYYYTILAVPSYNQLRASGYDRRGGSRSARMA